jgi:predicted dehydrogenase
MVRVAVAGLGKMGLSHLSIINALPGVEIVAICDPVHYVLDVLHKYTSIRGYTDYEKMLAEEIDAVIIATPSRFHVSMVRTALDKGLHVFCEKPFTLDWKESENLAELAETKELANQIGYHYRFVGSFQEVRRLLEAGAMGTVNHVLGEAYGPVVQKPKGSTWRTQKAEGGGCLYDYAAHPINLLNWYFGGVKAVTGARLNKIFSRDVDDEVHASLLFESGPTGQLSVNWSDASQRKMTTTISIWGTNGRIYADRQEVQVYLRDASGAPEGYSEGWNVRYTTELTKAVSFYLRGEEYTAQLEYFIRAIEQRSFDNVNSFRSGAETDRAISKIVADAGVNGQTMAATAAQKRFSFFGR